ncbi:DNA cytosine methyltransferase [Streptomyces sp. NPDC088910]|uniref:DNA cytosine methyltransferase n=1 Tax=Streptomyces sp. NPDC088910 TaxID=3365911 RepID=UPI003817F2F2
MTIPAAVPAGLRLGSLCSGYGGLDMAVQAVFGGSLAWVADNDPGAARILAHHHPHVPNLGDLTAVDWTGVEPVDVVCGGYPCQPFSSAGKRKGTADARHIWPHFTTALRVLRPQLGIFENVAGHIRLGLDAVLADLAGIGFDAEWTTLRASDVGAAHQRKRLFILAWPADPGGPRLARRRPEGAAPHCGDITAADALDLGSNRDRARGRRRDEPAPRRFTPADTTGICAGEPADQAHPVAERRDARPVPGSRGVRATADTARHGHRDTGTPCERGIPAATLAGRPSSAAHTAGGRRQGSPAGDSTEPAQQFADLDRPDVQRPDWGRYAPAVERWETVTGRAAPWPVDALGRLNPPLVEWLMGLPEGHVTTVPGLSRTAQLKALGNGVVPRQAEAALRHLADRAGLLLNEPAHVLRGAA